MEDKKLIPRRRVLGLGVALAGLCAGCAVLPAGSTESAVGSQAASEDKAVDKGWKKPPHLKSTVSTCATMQSCTTSTMTAAW